MKKLFLSVLLLSVLLLGLPLLGILATGKNVLQYCEIPPLTKYVAHAPFSSFIFSGILIFAVLVFMLLFLQLHHKQSSNGSKSQTHRTAMPWWGYLGVLTVLISWVAAWNRFSMLQPLQPYTFLPLWIGYILLINGLTFFRSGSCLLVNRPGYFFILFPVSACFWWFFEYLNRFVQNWYYMGINGFSVTEYIFHATLCFSTVLPAVVSTEECLSTSQRLTEPLKGSFDLRCKRTGWIWVCLFAASAFGLFGVGIWSDYLFPLLWLSPLFILISIQKITGQTTVFDSIGWGDWRPIWLPALAALVCGFFWELWNVKSFAHWEYSIPFVQKAHLFEMPLLGYLGYLPFGLECKAVASLVEDAMQSIAGQKKP